MRCGTRPLNTPRKIGFEAGQRGANPRENPYPVGSRESGEWCDGWEKGRELLLAAERAKEDPA